MRWALPRGYWVVKLIPKFAVGLLLFALPLFAQIHGVPASVTSHGPGRGPAPGVPASVTSIGRGIQGGTVTPVRPSVTSLGPNGFSNTCTNSALVPSALGCTNPAFTPTVNFHSGQVQFGQQFGRRRHRRDDRNYVYVPYAYPYYGYGYDNGYDQGYDPNQQQQAADQQPVDPNRVAPTMFDNGQYMGEMPQPQRSAAPAQSAPTGITSAAQPPVDPTVLVFRDGHQLEVRNYAIVGDTLYDIGGTTAKKIKLADLDLEKTAQVNDQRGVDFQLPKSTD
jgi:hypothetical protein